MTTLPAPTVQPSALIEPKGVRGSLYTLQLAKAYGKQCAEQERKRILGIVAEVAQAFGKSGECVFIGVRARAEKI